jgi:hypothetical protein
LSKYITKQIDRHLLVFMSDNSLGITRVQHYFPARFSDCPCVVNPLTRVMPLECRRGVHDAGCVGVQGQVQSDQETFDGGELGQLRYDKVRIISPTSISHL